MVEPGALICTFGLAAMAAWLMARGVGRAGAGAALEIGFIAGVVALVVVLVGAAFVVVLAVDFVFAAAFPTGLAFGFGAGFFSPHFALVLTLAIKYSPRKLRKLTEYNVQDLD